MSVKVFDLLTATPAPVSGKPEPTRSFQWLRNGTAISGANAQTYFLQPADEGALVSVRQIETNLIGRTTATSAAVGPIEEFVGIKALGGIETVINPEPDEFYRVHTFLESGDLTVLQGGEVEYLVVGGGGGGMQNSQFSNPRGGGGGAGGWQKYVAGEAHNTGAGPLGVSAGALSITVGLGGPGQSTGTNGKGGNSSIGSLIESVGGGQGVQGSVPHPEADGGSGGGGRDDFFGIGISGQGNDGGGSGSAGSGGGGGAGEKGQDGVTTDIASDVQCGNGGDGLPTSIDGTETFRAAGGGGGLRSGRSGTSRPGDGGLGGGGDGASASEDAITGLRDATSGAPNTGSGGGGGSASRAAGNGGSGIVIIRYPITEAEYNAEVA